MRRDWRFSPVQSRIFFEEVEASVPFETTVTFGPTPDLFQLARLLDDLETAIVALVDTNTARFFATRRGWLKEIPGPNDNPKYYGKRAVGGWSQANYQRHADEVRTQFARQVAEELEKLVDRYDAVHVFLAGDEVALPYLRRALSQRVTELLHDEVLRLDIRTSSDNVQSDLDRLLQAAEDEQAKAKVDRLIGEIRSAGLGISGEVETRHALEQGQVDTLLLDAGSELGEGARNELIRLALLSSSEVEIVEGHEQFKQLGGVGALMRYKLEY